MDEKPYAETSADSLTLLNSSLLADLFSLTSLRDVPSLLRQALQIARRLFRAEAGSAFFASQPPHTIRLGDNPEPIADHILQMEALIARRLQKGVWRVPNSDAPLVSVRHFPAQNRLILNAPLLSGNRLVGSLTLTLPRTLPLDRRHHIALTRLGRGIGQLATLAADLHLARQRYRELDLIYKIGQGLVSTLEVDKLLATIMEESANALDAAAASIMLIDEKRQELVFEAHSPGRLPLRKQRIGLHEGIAGWVARHGKPTIANNVNADPRFSRNVDVRTGFLTLSIAAVPIQMKGKTVGVLEVLNKHARSGFTEEDLHLMSAIAAQAAIALENARLYQSLREERDKIIKAQEEVRKELSRNLHDGTIQQLSAISMNLEYAKKLLQHDPQAAHEELTNIQKLANKAAREARLLLFELRPIILETQGLLPTLEQYVTQLNENENFVVEAEFAPIPPLKKDVAGTIFSIIQEAINNIKRHARATHVKITVNATAEHMLVHVKDNGTGFDVSKVKASYTRRGSLGLLNMEERARLLDGVLAITSNTEGPDRGTTVTLSIPIKPGTGFLDPSKVAEQNHDHH